MKSHALYLILRDRIGSGAWGPGDRLPGEWDVARYFEVSRATARRALGRLQAEGFISRRAGTGTHVTASVPADRLRLDLTRPDALAALALSLHATDMAPASETLARALSLTTGQPVRRAIHVAHHLGQACAHLLTHREETATSTSVIVAEHPPGALIEQMVSAELATPEVAAVLAIDTGAPLVVLTRLTRTAHGPGLEHLRALFRPDLVELSLNNASPSP